VNPPSVSAVGCGYWQLPVGQARDLDPPASHRADPESARRAASNQLPVSCRLRATRLPAAEATKKKWSL